MKSGRDLVRSLYGRVEHLIHELAKFGIVGAIAFVVDVGTFNLLRNGAMDDRPLTAKVISTVAGHHRRLRRQPAVDLPAPRAGRAAP